MILWHTIAVNKLWSCLLDVLTSDRVSSVKISQRPSSLKYLHCSPKIPVEDSSLLFSNSFDGPSRLWSVATTAEHFSEVYREAAHVGHNLNPQKWPLYVWSCAFRDAYDSESALREWDNPTPRICNLDGLYAVSAFSEKLCSTRCAGAYSTADTTKAVSLLELVRHSAFCRLAYSANKNWVTDRHPVQLHKCYDLVFSERELFAKNSRSRSLFAVARPSVCRLSVCV